MAFKRNTLGTKTLFLVCTLAMMFSVSCLAQNKDGQLDQMTKEAWIEAFQEKCRVSDSSIEWFRAYEEYPWWGKDGLIPVRVGNKWGFADTNAIIVIEPQFKNVSYFYEERDVFKFANDIYFTSIPFEDIVLNQINYVEKFYVHTRYAKSSKELMKTGYYILDEISKDEMKSYLSNPEQGNQILTKFLYKK